MTTVGDLGVAPMNKFGAQAPIRRKKLTKKQGVNKMKTFRELVQENLAQEKLVRKIKVEKEYTKLKVQEKEETIESFLRDSGYKIKEEYPNKYGKELFFYRISDAKSAFEDLKVAGFGEKYSIDLANNVITYK